jgi:hypothetical protein
MPFSRIHYENLFTNAGTGLGNMVDFFRDYSHGNIDIGGSQVFGPLTIQHDHAAYTGSGANPAGRRELLKWVRDAALAAGIDLSRFRNLVGCMNVSTDLFGSVDGMITPSGDILNDHSPAMLAQEMLHGYSLQHSQEEGGPPYSDKWDAMSTWSQFSTPGGPFYSIGPGSNAANMAFLNWLDPARVWSKSGSYDEQIDLRPHHRRDLDGILVAFVGPYYVEYRHQGDWDATIPRDAVLVHRLEGDHSILMKSQNGSFDIPAGDAFERNDNGDVCKVTVTEINAAHRRATVRLLRKFPQATVPDVYHASQAEATSVIERAGLHAAFKGTGLPGDKWVGSQSPDAGRVVARGSTVTCILQREPPPPSENSF